MLPLRLPLPLLQLRHKNRGEQGRWMPYTKVATKAESSLGLHLRYAFEPGEQRGATLGNPLFDLLSAVLELGSIRHAAQSLGCSYRYLWGSLRKWEQKLGEPLIIWSQGQRARPTQFAEKLLWAERRARTRMQPHIEALRSDLARVVAEARDQRHQLLAVQASHDMALSLLQEHVADTADLHLDIRFREARMPCADCPIDSASWRVFTCRHCVAPHRCLPMP